MRGWQDESASLARSVLLNSRVSVQKLGFSGVDSTFIVNYLLSGIGVPSVLQEDLFFNVIVFLQFSVSGNAGLGLAMVSNMLPHMNLDHPGPHRETSFGATRFSQSDQVQMSV